jgi:hypothetical protein
MNGLVLTGASADEAWPLVRDFHYSRRMPGGAQHCFVARLPGGLFGETGEPLAAAMYGNPVNKYLSGGPIELLRLVRSPEYKRPLSELVAWSLRWLRANTTSSVCVSYADSAEGHHGGIYQATGFLYCGEKGVPFDKVAGFKDSNGDFVHARTLNARYGTHQRDWVLQRHPDWSVVEALPKHFYIKPLRRKLGALLKHHGWELLPYPKPNAARLLDAQVPTCESEARTLGAAPTQSRAA